MHSDPPAAPDGHGLLSGRIVLVTAAAGTGIGFATAQRAVEEGATVVLSDAHERRLVEAAERLAAIGPAPLAVPCDVTDEAQVQRSSPRQSNATAGSTWWCATPGWEGRPRWPT